MKLQAPKQVQPLGMRVVMPLLMNDDARLLGDAGIAAWRAKPNFLDPPILQRPFKSGDQIVVDHTFGEQYVAAALFLDGQSHFADNPTSWGSADMLGSPGPM